MTALTMRLSFSTNVRVGTGAAGSGLDEAMDHMAPLGSGAIKGLLRDEARWILPWTTGDHPFVQAVFGGPSGQHCPWNFDIGQLSEVRYSARASLRLDSDGSVVKGGLRVKEEASIKETTLDVTQRMPLSVVGLPASLRGQEWDCHVALLHLAARATEKMGQERTRGLGWVSIGCDPGAPRTVSSDLDLIWQIRSEVTPS